MKAHYLITALLVLLLFIKSNARIESENAHQTLSEIANVLMNYYATTQDFDGAQVLVNENEIEFGDIVTYRDPYSGKRRPGLVIEIDGDDLTIAQISSVKRRLSRRKSLDLPGRGAQLKVTPGLRKLPSYAYLSKTSYTNKYNVGRMLFGRNGIVRKTRVINREDIFN
jgi:hypothetical protein